MKLSEPGKHPDPQRLCNDYTGKAYKLFDGGGLYLEVTHNLTVFRRGCKANCVHFEER